MADESGLLRILISSDIHLGYGEKLSIRNNDSFNSFDELLTVGKEQNVDMCILGGDLFHENKPSRLSQIKCIQILSKHVLGDGDVMLEYISEPEVDFRHCNTKAVNYEDPNMNVSLPVFSIHGNHDDPTGLGGFSCLDLLHEARLVNYFGKVDNLKEIKVSPILLKRGEVYLALYGISSIKDERLHRLFRENKVEFEAPSEEKNWFHILVIHQNRAKRGPTNYIPENFIPGFFHLVIWGHEHDCRIEPEVTEKDDVYISQPGSPVATSLCEGESLEKKIGILNISPDNRFKMETIPLKTVRPMKFKTIALSDLKNLNLDEKDDKKLQRSLDRELGYVVDEMIREAELLLTGHPDQGKLPLIRLRVEYDQENQQLSPVRFGNSYIDRVANHADILLFKRKKTEGKVKSERSDGELLDALPSEAGKSMEDYLLDYFNSKEEDGSSKMSILSVRGLNGAIGSFINKGDGDAISYNVKKQLSRRQTDLLNKLDPDTEQDIEAVIQGSVDINEDEESELTAAELNAANRVRRAPPPQVDDMDIKYSDEEEEKPLSKGSSRARNGIARSSGNNYDSDDDSLYGGKRGRRGAATGGRGSRGGGRKAAASRIEVSDDDDEDFSGRRPVSPPPAPKPRGGRGSRARGRGATGTASTRARGGRGRGGGQASISEMFASQSQRSTATTQNTSSRPTPVRSQRNKKQVFESDSD